MEKLTFTLDNAERSCRPGRDYAATLFKPGKPYTLRDIIDAGLSATSIAWLLFERARRDSSTVPLVQAWARKLCQLQRVRGQKFSTPGECMEAIRASMTNTHYGQIEYYAYPHARGLHAWGINGGKFGFNVKRGVM